MKVLVAIAVFTFVTVQLSYAAPRPDEEKKAEPEVASAPAADSTAARVPAGAQSIAEVKAAEPAVQAIVSAVAPSENVKPAEDKKA